ncbi:hypothetical protein, partial [Pseudoalteromonas prydzensis]
TKAALRALKSVPDRFLCDSLSAEVNRTKVDLLAAVSEKLKVVRKQLSAIFQILINWLKERINTKFAW